jgi:cation transport regulator ChaB
MAHESQFDPRDIENDGESQKRVGEYLDLIDKYGPDHEKVAAFLAAHHEDSDIRSWSQVVAELNVKGRAAPRQTARLRPLWGVVVAAVPLLAILSVYALLGLKQAQGDLAQAKDTLAQKDKELGTYANAKREIDGIRAELNTAKLQNKDLKDAADTSAREAVAAQHALSAVQNELRTEKGLVAGLRSKVNGLEQAVGESSVAIKKERARAESAESKIADFTASLNATKKDLANLQHTYSELKTEYDRRVKSNPDRIALVIANCNRAANGVVYVPWRREDIDKLFPDGADLAPGSHYARAILLDWLGDQKSYRQQLERVPKDDPWWRLADAELLFSKGESSAMQNWLAELEQKIRDSSKDDAFAMSFLLMQKEASLDATMRVYRKLKDKNSAVNVKLLGEQAIAQAPNTRLASMDMLAALGPYSKDAVEALTKVLKDESPQLRWQAAYTLGEIGPVIRDVRLELDEVFKNDKDPRVRTQAARAIRRIDPFFAAREP